MNIYFQLGVLLASIWSLNISLCYISNVITGMTTLTGYLLRTWLISLASSSSCLVGLWPTWWVDRNIKETLQSLNTLLTSTSKVKVIIVVMSACRVPLIPLLIDYRIYFKFTWLSISDPCRICASVVLVRCASAP